MIFSYIYAKGFENCNTQYYELIEKYNTIFNYPEENNAEKEMKNYINDLNEIVEKYSTK